MDDNELINKALGVAHTLTYNEEPQGAAKHLLHELSHRLGAKTLRVHRKTDGLLLISAFGQSRFMTLRERILYRLFGVVPPMASDPSKIEGV